MKHIECILKKTSAIQDHTVSPAEKCFSDSRHSSPWRRLLAVTTQVIEPVVRGGVGGVAEGHAKGLWILFTVAIKLPLEMDLISWCGEVEGWVLSQLADS